MPLYEYECEGCGKRFELIQKFSDPPTSTCKDCGGTANRLLSAPAIQFKGSGWYVTDYARKSAPPEKSEGKSEGKAETKAGGDAAAKKDAKAPASTGKESD
jgi:putative FmdB family regulatory protein